ncbi:MAG TPA: hypothetical protein VKE98_15835, partial [Gemmataceae bacterium]|nr:hypothetical protein [Gemmataceae bacterium]
KKHGITTPYTSYLVAPDAVPAPVAANNTFTPDLGVPISGAYRPGALGVNMPRSAAPGTAYRGFDDVDGSITGRPNTFAVGGDTHAVPMGGNQPATKYRVFGAVPQLQGNFQGITQGNGGGTQFVPAFDSPTMEWAVPTPGGATGQPCTSSVATGPSPRSKDLDDEQEEEEEESSESPAKVPTTGAPLAAAGKDGVDLSLLVNDLRTQSQVAGAAVRQVAGRNCRSVRGAWIDEQFTAKMTMVKIKAQSDAYFRLLERHPELREVFRLGNRVVWITPSRTALVIDVNSGEEKLSDEAIDRLFQKP